ncbi:MAG: ATP-dependent DNA helicase, partial [Bacteroides sp.]|nr:ATP-dependent DNA helicase [Bacteroides sp.]
QQELQQELQKSTLYSEVLRCLVHNTLSRQDISIALGQKKVSGQLNKVVQKLVADRLIERTIPDKPNHPAQKFQLTEWGRIFLNLLDD